MVQIRRIDRLVSRKASDKNKSLLFDRLDTYVQISLCNSTGEDIVTNRTGTRHGQNNPIYAERYPFNIQENLLNEISFFISVINKKPSGKTDRDFGWISFG